MMLIISSLSARSRRFTSPPLAYSGHQSSWVPCSITNRPVNPSCLDDGDLAQGVGPVALPALLGQAQRRVVPRRVVAHHFQRVGPRLEAARQGKAVAHALRAQA